MTLTKCFLPLRLLAGVLAMFTVASCSIVSKGPGGQITKVKYYKFQPSQVLNTEDQAILFEYQYHQHGAYTAKDILGRSGHYYSVMWKADDRTQPVTVRLEYRQAGSGLAVKTKEQQVADVRRKNLTQFEVTGEEFLKDGSVSSWRVSLLRGKEVLASQNSYLWE